MEWIVCPAQGHSNRMPLAAAGKRIGRDFRPLHGGILREEWFIGVPLSSIPLPTGIRAAFLRRDGVAGAGFFRPSISFAFSANNGVSGNQGPSRTAPERLQDEANAIQDGSRMAPGIRLLKCDLHLLCSFRSEFGGRARAVADCHGFPTSFFSAERPSWPFSRAFSGVRFFVVYIPVVDRDTPLLRSTVRAVAHCSVALIFLSSALTSDRWCISRRSGQDFFLRVSNIDNSPCFGLFSRSGVD